MTLDELYKGGEIGRGHYLTYMIFVQSEAGAEWFEQMILSTFFEDVPPIGDHGYAMYYGRITWLKNIKQMIDDVQNLLEKNA